MAGVDQRGVRCRTVPRRRTRSGTAWSTRRWRQISGDLPGSTLDFLRLAVLDWVGVTVAGAAEPSARLLQGFVVDEGGTPVSRALGTDLRMSARQAALVNGAAGHALDFDDMGLGGTHPSVAILPAVFALAEKRHAGGRALAERAAGGLSGAGPHQLRQRLECLPARVPRDRNGGHPRRGGGLRQAAWPGRSRATSRPWGWRRPRRRG